MMAFITMNFRNKPALNAEAYTISISQNAQAANMSISAYTDLKHGVTMA